jgi:hypothetical protein
MDMSTVLIIAMGLMMVVMCGGMVAGVVAMVRQRRDRGPR